MGVRPAWLLLGYSAALASLLLALPAAQSGRWRPVLASQESRLGWSLGGGSAAIFAKLVLLRLSLPPPRLSFPPQPNLKQSYYSLKS